MSELRTVLSILYGSFVVSSVQNSHADRSGIRNCGCNRLELY